MQQFTAIFVGRKHEADFAASYPEVIFFVITPTQRRKILPPPPPQRKHTHSGAPGIFSKGLEQKFS